MDSLSPSDTTGALSQRRLGSSSRIWISLSLLGASSWAFATTPVAPTFSVRLGSEDIPRDEVGAAEQRCRGHADLDVGACLDRFFVPRWLLDRQARDQRRADELDWVHRGNDLLHLALLERMTRDVPAASEHSVDEYIASHPRDFNRPLRIRIFRLLVTDEAEAKQVLAEITFPLDVVQFRALCRKYSLDKATHERGGDLGFVWPDGSTDVPQVSADPALYAAALGLQEGELRTTPVAEGKHQAIVWRRGSLPQETTSAAERSRAATLVRQRTIAERTSNLLAALKQQSVKDRADVLLGRLRRKGTGLFTEP